MNKTCIECGWTLYNNQKKFCCPACKNEYHKNKKKSIRTVIKELSNSLNEASAEINNVGNKLEGIDSDIKEFEKKLKLLEEKFNNPNNERNKE